MATDSNNAVVEQESSQEPTDKPPTRPYMCETSPALEISDKNCVFCLKKNSYYKNQLEDNQLMKVPKGRGRSLKMSTINSINSYDNGCEVGEELHVRNTRMASDSNNAVYEQESSQEPTDKPPTRPYMCETAHVLEISDKICVFGLKKNSYYKNQLEDNQLIKVPKGRGRRLAMSTINSNNSYDNGCEVGQEVHVQINESIPSVEISDDEIYKLPTGYLNVSGESRRVRSMFLQRSPPHVERGTGRPLRIFGNGRRIQNFVRYSRPYHRA